MARPQPLIYHYNTQPLPGHTLLSCGKLTQEIADRWVPPRIAEAAEAAAAAAGAAAAADTDADATAAAAAAAADIGDLDEAELWADVARLQWAMISDRTLNVRIVSTLIHDLSADGELNRIRASFRRLVAAVTILQPDIARAVAVQLVALGRDLTIAASDSPDLFEFVKKELQPVDLASLLQV